jgi:hypothetical protein
MLGAFRPYLRRVQGSRTYVVRPFDKPLSCC